MCFLQINGGSKSAIYSWRWKKSTWKMNWLVWGAIASCRRHRCRWCVASIFCDSFVCEFGVLVEWLRRYALLHSARSINSHSFFSLSCMSLSFSPSLSLSLSLFRSPSFSFHRYYCYYYYYLCVFDSKCIFI